MTWNRRGRGRMVAGFTTTCETVPITTKFVSSNPVHGEVYSMQHYVIKFGTTSMYLALLNLKMWKKCPELESIVNMESIWQLFPLLIHF
jgi:hypothetical protein